MAHGEAFSEAFESIRSRVEARKSKNLVAIGINCINPDFVSDLFRTVQRKDVPFVVYPNSGVLRLDSHFETFLIFIILGETYSVEEGWKGKNSCKPLEEYTSEWIDLGAKYVGGCCRSSAKDIKNIKKKVQELQS